jgi:hypothetical protein
MRYRARRAVAHQQTLKFVRQLHNVDHHSLPHQDSLRRLGESSSREEDSIHVYKCAGLNAEIGRQGFSFFHHGGKVQKPADRLGFGIYSHGYKILMRSCAARLQRRRSAAGQQIMK